MILIRKILIVFLTISFLSGCAALKTPQPIAGLQQNLTWQQRQTESNKLTNWTAEGSLSVTFDHKTDIAYFAWQQTAQNYGIDLHAPLNLKQLQLVGNNKQVTLWESPTVSISAPTPEVLIKRQLGWTLPISNLVYWIRGIPAPVSSAAQASTQQLDNYNHLIMLQQQGWNIQYVGFQTVNNIDLPHIIYLQTQELKIKLVIKKWEMQ